MAEVRVRVDPGKCIGAAVCVGIAPNVFRLNSDNISEVVDEGGADKETLISAAMACPSVAIEVLDGASGKRLAP
jgi:ferredoxin